jgi:hypothetical protein
MRPTLIPAEVSTSRLARNVLALTAGMYPFSTPTEPVRMAMAEIGLPEPQQRFTDDLREGLVTWLVDAAVRSA